ncbi:hypothetical protein ACVWY3_005033 [Bradyrhizobium sp. USDA 4486]
MRWQCRALEQKDLPALPAHLRVHELDFTPDEVNVRHFSPLNLE